MQLDEFILLLREKHVTSIELTCVNAFTVSCTSPHVIITGNIPTLLKALRDQIAITRLYISCRHLKAKDTRALLRVFEDYAVPNSLDLHVDSECGDALANVLRASSAVNELRVSTNDLYGCMESLSDALKANTGLTKLDLSDSKVGRGALRHLLGVLEVNTTLKILCLQRVDMDPIDLLELVGALKTNKTLTVLDISFSTSRGSVQIVSDMLSVNTGLVELGLSGTFELTDRIEPLADALRTNTTLTKLNLSDNWLDMCAMFEVLKRNMTLTEIDLSSNGVDARSLSEMLKVNTTLRVLDLSDCEIEPDGTRLLAEALKVNTTLTDLRLYITDVDPDALSDALRVNTTLTNLGMDDGATNDDSIDRFLHRNRHLRNLIGAREGHANLAVSGFCFGGNSMFLQRFFPPWVFGKVVEYI